MVSREDLYRAGRAPWDIGRPQRAIVELAEAGRVRGRVLDAGCGSAEHAMLFAERGHEAWGVDAEPHAIASAKDKAAARGLRVELRVLDALDLGALDTKFDAIVDSGLFHVFDDQARTRYARSVAAALADGGRVHLLCFSDREPPWGAPRPRRVSQDEIVQTFAPVGLALASIREAAFEKTWGEPAAAWLTELARA